MPAETGSPTAQEWGEKLRRLRVGANDASPVSGLTHCFYRYPARFSPAFAGAAIEAFSEPGDHVLDPFMGGGTTIVEAASRGRAATGCDVNSLAVFIAHAKTTLLAEPERRAIRSWAEATATQLNYRQTAPNLDRLLDAPETRNLHLPVARPIKKLVGLALLSLRSLPTEPARVFARCALLNVGQWALDGRSRGTPLTAFRSRLQLTVAQMLDGHDEYQRTHSTNGGMPPILIHGAAADLPSHRPFDSGALADLVVTSPPYPGIHIIYHRWQVDGRRETPAPYWIAACRDGRGNAYYNFADRRERLDLRYFQELAHAFRGVRQAVKRGAMLVQLVAFKSPKRQLPRYLVTLRAAGFEEVRGDLDLGQAAHKRIWRSIPSRRWHASLQGELPSAREVVLVHRAI